MFILVPWQRPFLRTDKDPNNHPFDAMGTASQTRTKDCESNLNKAFYLLMSIFFSIGIIVS
jgi:hypothetical protein